MTAQPNRGAEVVAHQPMPDGWTPPPMGFAPPTEACDYCGREYPAPVSLHHTEQECEGPSDDAMVSTFAAPPTDILPHSRACGIVRHEHGVACSRNCPTCEGREFIDTTPPIAVPEKWDGISVEGRLGCNGIVFDGKGGAWPCEGPFDHWGGHAIYWGLSEEERKNRE